MYGVHARRFNMFETSHMYVYAMYGVRVRRACATYMYGVHVRRTCMIV